MSESMALKPFFATVHPLNEPPSEHGSPGPPPPMDGSVLAVANTEQPALGDRLATQRGEAGLRHLLVLLAAATAHADPAHELAVRHDREAARHDEHLAREHPQGTEVELRIRLLHVARVTRRPAVEHGGEGFALGEALAQ